MAAGGTLIRTQSFDVASDTPVWMANARKDMGITEWVKNKNTPNPVVQRWVQEAMGDKEVVDVTSDGHPWCAHYVGAKLVEAGYPSSHSGMARSYLKYGTQVDKGDDAQWKLGDIVVFWRGKSNDGVTGHVAFLLSWDRNYVYVLGGNQGDEVSIMRNARSKILGVRRPRSFFTSKTAISSVGSATSTVANKAVGATIPDAPDLSMVSPAHADTLTSSMSGVSIDAGNSSPMPSPADLQAAYDQAHPYLTMMEKVKPELMIVLTLISVGLALYAGYWRYLDWKKGRT